MAAVVANVVMTLMGRVAVNLNYTCSSETLNYCLQQCNIRHVLTSRRILEKLDLKLDAELVYLEDFKDRITLWDKLGGWIEAHLPLGMLERRLGVDRLKPDDLLTVIFTSGSTGKPKGVMLSYRNIGANAQAINEVVQLSPSDVLLGILPMFHCFGFTVTLWSVLALDIKAAYHFSPLEAQQIGKLCHTQNVTIMLSTPTFLRSYLKRIAPSNSATWTWWWPARKSCQPICAKHSRRNSACGRSRVMGPPNCRRWFRSICRPVGPSSPARV